VRRGESGAGAPTKFLRADNERGKERGGFKKLKIAIVNTERNRIRVGGEDWEGR